MSVNLDQIAAQIIGALKVSDPELDTSIGTPTRKIIDAVAESISEAYIDHHMLTYQYDIDAKVEADLDDFVQMFGLARMPAKRATGTVIFSRTTANRTVFIPVHTQIRSEDQGAPSIIAQTVTGATMPEGALVVSVPVQAVLAGTEGNVAAGTLTRITSPVQGANTVTNPQPLSGGTRQETDLELRARWKATVFRSLAGTEQMYHGIAIDDPSCYAANVVGASKKRREQVEIIGGQATCTVEDAAYIYADPVFVGPNIDGGNIYLKGDDYNWNTSTNPPKVIVLDATKIKDEDIVEVDFEYKPICSRNDPANGITNRVDIWCGGQRAVQAVQSVIFRSNIRFTNTPTDRRYNQKFRRPDGTRPLVNNVFVPLAFGPIITVPPTLSIGGDTYAQIDDEHGFGDEETIGGETVTYAYQIVHDDTAFGYTATSAFGLEWDEGSLAGLNNKVFSIGGQTVDRSDYTYNAMISFIQTNIDKWRLVGIDAKAHQAVNITLRFSLAVVYTARFNPAQVNDAIAIAISEYLTQVGFQGRVQVSDILQVAHNVPGVDNVRFLRGSDYPGYVAATPNNYDVGIQQIVGGAVNKSFVDSTGRPKDIRFGDNELPVYDSLVVDIRAENSFGTA